MSLSRPALLVSCSFLLMAVVAPISVAFAEGAENPHIMRRADGSTDDSKCAVCHDDDLGLRRSPLETCTLCHAETTHSGSREHVAASPEAVARALSVRKDKEPELPLTKEGRMYCGTCHLFHDPVVASEEFLAKGRSPSTSAVGNAVSEALRSRGHEIAKAHGLDSPGARLNPRGTVQLRLPNADGSLCRQCHQGY